MDPIVVDKATKTYGDTGGYRDVSFSVNEGEMFGLIGPDGAGKTSLIRTLCTLLHQDAGTVTVLGYDGLTETGEIRSRIGYMPQKFSLYPDLTVQQNIAFYADLFGVPAHERPRRLADLYRFSRLEPFKHRRAGRLSGGMKQKLALSCNLIHTPALLILDEPTFGVDPVSRAEFWDLLGEIRRQGSTILVSTPYMDEAERFDRLALMHQGRVLRIGTPREVRAGYPYLLYRTVAPDLRALRDFFSGQANLVTLQLFGDALHVSFTREPDPALLKVWRDQAGITAWERIDPGLEDVFLHEMGGERD